MSGKTTPMLEQYLQIKAQHPGALLLFRMGDFYETFFDDAARLAEICGVVLTTRDRKSDHPVPLAGVPHHALDSYLGRLLEAGLTVAICEQVEDPAQAKGLVRREVVEVLSPGTATRAELLGGASGLYCLAYLPGGEGTAGWAVLDASTGDFRCGQEAVTVADLCQRHPVREVVVREDTDGARLAAWRAALPQVVLNGINTSWFHPRLARQTLREHFGVETLDAFGLPEGRGDLAAGAAGALLRYLTSLTLARPAQVVGLRLVGREDRLTLDEETLRNLEIFRTFRGERGEGTLLHHLDATVTPMGRRLLESRLAEGLTDLGELERWHAGVDGACRGRAWRERLRGLLRELGDLERQAARTAAGRIGPAGLRRLGDGLATVGALAEAAAAEVPADHPVAAWSAALPRLGDLADRLRRCLPEQPPAVARGTGLIADGVDPDLDACRAIARDTRGYLAGLQASERERTGIGTLKVGFNKVFGYYFEVTRKHVDRVPQDYVQKQTLVNANRYHNDALKEAEARILGAEEQAEQLERRLFEELATAAADRYADLRRTAGLLAGVDLMLAFAELAERRDYCRPRCDGSTLLAIEAGRHPVVEQLLDDGFIPNDVELDGDRRQILLLTGPNMGGKSTYLRQVALIVLMAQAGSFVPARSARIGVADRIFTRVGASDNVARGQSTFFTEMSETAHILHQMTSRSLVVLDEIGRGTSTYDGLSLAWAITEHLGAADGPRPRTVFATHYHELTELESELPGLVNLRLMVREWEGRIIFLHSVQPGRSDKSYGIHVARLAGIPEPVLRRAALILESLSLEDRRALAGGHFRDAPGGASTAADRDGAPEPAPGGAGPRQLSLFSDGERDALAALQELDLERISPVDAFMWLVRIKRQLADSR